jgi:two-component system, NarL family, sensor kinase
VLSYAFTFAPQNIAPCFSKCGVENQKMRRGTCHFTTRAQKSYRVIFEHKRHNRKIIISLILFLITTSQISAQNYLVDSLKNIFPKCTTDSARVMVLVDLAFNTKNYDTLNAMHYANQALEISYRVDDPRIKATALRVAGVLQETHYRHAKALSFYNQGLELITGRTDLLSQFLVSTIKLEIGNTYLFQGNIASSIPYYLESQRFLEEKQPTNIILVFLYNNMAGAYFLAGMREKGFSFSQKAVALAERLKSKKALAHAYTVRACMELDTSEPDVNHATELMEKAKDYAVELGDWVVLGKYHSFQSALQKKEGNLERATQESKTSITYFTRVHNHLLIAEAFISIAQIQMLQGNIKEAFTSYSQAMQIGDLVNCAFIKREALQGLGQTSESMTQIPAALNYYRKYQHLNDSILDADARQQIFIEEAQQEFRQQQEQIALLLQEKEVQALHLRQKNLSNLYLIIIMVSGIGIVFLIALYLRGKHKILGQQNEIQNKQIIELEKDKQYVAIQALLQGQEEERTRIARDIHDSVGSMLSSAKHTLTSLKENVAMAGDNIEVYNKSVDLIDSSMHELRRVAHNMMPETLLRFGLKESLRDFCDRLTNPELTIKFIPLNIEHRLTSQKELIVYRIVQELVTNAIKHSNGSEILVQLVQSEKTVSLTVEDNGVGFDPASLGTCKGAGWINIYNRVDMLSGRLELDSRPSLGTSVTIEFNA